MLANIADLSANILVMRAYSEAMTGNMMDSSANKKDWLENIWVKRENKWANPENSSDWLENKRVKKENMTETLENTRDSSVNMKDL